MKKEMLINVLQPEECRIAILEDGVLEELYVERTSHESYTGNIYKGRVVNLEPAIQAAFVDFSVGRNGFLHVSDVEPQYYRRNLSEQAELNPRDRDREREPRRDRPAAEPRAAEPRSVEPRAVEPRAPEPRAAEPRRDRASRSSEDREPPTSGGFGEGLLDPRRDRPDRSERGRRDRSEPRRFGEGLEGEESQPPKRAAEPDRFAPDEAPRRLRSEVPPPPSTRSVESPYLRSPAPEPPPRDEPYVERSPYSRKTAPAPTPTPPPVRDEPVAERPRSNPGGGFIRPSEPEPVDPDLPPSRTQRSRPAPPRVSEEDTRARTAPPAPRDFEPEPEAPSAREPRRPRGRGRSRPAPEPETQAPAPFEPIAEVEPRDFEPTPEPILDEPTEPSRRRGGRDAIRSRGGDRPQPPAPERTRPTPPAAPAERARPFAPDLEADRPQPSEPEWARTAVPEKTRSYTPDREADRPQPTAPERSRPTPPPERTRSFAAELDLDRPAQAPPERSRPTPPPERTRPAPPERNRSFAAELDVDRPAPEPTRERGRGGDRGRAPEVETPARDPRSKPHDRAGEEGYIPRRLRHGGAEAEITPPAWPDLSDDEDTGIGADSDEDGEGGDEQEGGTTKEGGRRRRRRRGRRRDRETVDRAPAPAETDIDADVDHDLDPVDSDDHDDFDEAVPARSEVVEAHGADLDDLTSTADFDFGDEHGDDEFDDEDDLGPKTSRASDPDDQIDPELEEEIRREIEEIAELEREMGLRGTVEARPRRGDDAGKGGARGRGTVKPPIQEIFRRGDEVLIQVIKESIGTKGPTLSTYISIPGRYLVLMPGLNRVGVSRKIADEGQRRKLREIMTELNPPKGLGFIVRTAGLDRSKRELARDLAYLLRLWKVILRRIKKAKSPAPIYQESDMITRTIRDIFTSEIDTIWIDEPAAFERAQEFLRVVMPRFVDRLKLYDEKVPLFHKYGIEDEIAKIQRRRVDLPEGGSIVIDQTEALVAIDVNSGNFRVENDAERTAYEMNLRAAKEIARQLRLRDLGGVIVNDFIDMRDEKNRRGVEHALRDAIKRDRARTKVLRMSQFGLIEMTRQRIRPSLKRSVYEDCSHCAGAGVVKTTESMSIDVMRILALASHREEIRRVNIGVHPGVAVHLNNRKRKEIARIELDANMTIHIRHEADAPAEHLQVDCFDANNNEIRLFPPAAPDRHHRRGSQH